MLESLSRLGLEISLDENQQLVSIAGCDGNLPQDQASLFVDNSGTTIRFLTAMLGLHGGDYRLSGAPRMHERPIGPLVQTLQKLGAKISTESSGDCPPVVIKSERVSAERCEVSGEISSQYASGLMLASPLLQSAFTIGLRPPVVSRPYLEMTCKVMNEFGIETNLQLDRSPLEFSISAGQQYCAGHYEIEPDASAASYFLAIPAICGGSATVTQLGSDSLQGDIRFAHCLEKMGCEVTMEKHQITVQGKAMRGIDVDMSDISDTVQTLAAVALFVEGPTTVRGVAHNRVKETDRIGNLAIELRKLGAAVQEHEDGLTIVPGQLQSTEIETYNDHRMAMSLSLPGLMHPGIIIRDPACTAKTYPNFFADLKSAIGTRN